LINAGVESLNTEEINNEIHIKPDWSLSEIETALSSPNEVVFDEGTHELSGTAEITADNVSITIRENATVRADDDASLDTYTDDQGTSGHVLFLIDNQDGVDWDVQGTVDGNLTNQPESALFPVWYDGRNGGGEGCVGGQFKWTGDLLDANHLLRLSDTADLVAPLIYSNGPVTAPVVAEGSVGCHFETVIHKTTDSSVENEVIDFNAFDSDCTVGKVIAIGDGHEQLVDINGSSEIHVESIIAHGKPTRFVTMGPDPGARLTDKNDPGARDNTIDSVKGHCASTGIELAGSGSTGNMFNTTIRGIQIKTDGPSIVASSGADNQHDNLTLKGRVVQTGGANAVWLNKDNDHQMAGLDIDLSIIESGDNGAIIEDWDRIMGEVRAQNTVSSGLILATKTGNTLSQSELKVNIHNAATGVLVGGSSSGEVNETTIRGTVKNSGANDIEVRSTVTGLRLDVDYDTISNNGSGVTEAQYSSI
jgi:hypothetical protein